MLKYWESEVALGYHIDEFHNDVCHVPTKSIDGIHHNSYDGMTNYEIDVMYHDDISCPKREVYAT